MSTKNIFLYIWICALYVSANDAREISDKRVNRIFDTFTHRYDECLSAKNRSELASAFTRLTSVRCFDEEFYDNELSQLRLPAYLSQVYDVVLRRGLEMNEDFLKRRLNGWCDSIQESGCSYQLVVPLRSIADEGHVGIRVQRQEILSSRNTPCNVRVPDDEQALDDEPELDEDRDDEGLDGEDE